MKTLRELKVGDKVIVIENDQPGRRMTEISAIKSIGRRWITVERWVYARFDINTGHNDSTNSGVPRICTSSMLEQQDRLHALNDEVRSVLSPHGFWRGRELPIDKLERIATILREP